MRITMTGTGRSEPKFTHAALNLNWSNAPTAAIVLDEYLWGNGPEPEMIGFQYKVSDEKVTRIPLNTVLL